MSAFYVGQRVRIVGPPAHFLIGREVTVTQTNVHGFLTPFSQPFIGIAINITHLAGFDCVYPMDCLQPILPPGLESLAETLALWLPEGETA